jgi:hypothetical protein
MRDKIYLIVRLLDNGINGNEATNAQRETGSWINIPVIIIHE